MMRPYLDPLPDDQGQRPNSSERQNSRGMIRPF